MAEAGSDKKPQENQTKKADDAAVKKALEPVTGKPEPKMFKAKIAPRRSVFMGPTHTALPGEIIELSEKDFRDLSEGGYVVSHSEQVDKEGFEPGTKVQQAGNDAVTIQREKPPVVGVVASVTR